MKKISCTAAGDAMIMRRLPGRYDGFDELSAFISQGDFRFVNLETTIHRFETYGAAVSGGSWFCSEPEVLEDIKALGFNAVSTCNNHALDYSHRGLELTLDYVNASGLKNAGVGRNLREASAPVYVDTPQGRIAYIGICSSFKEDAPAGDQSAYLPGRPGLNPLRTSSVYQLPAEELTRLAEIAEKLAINKARETSVKEGYAAPLKPGTQAFGEMIFREGEPGKVTTLNKADMERTLKGIEEARYMADYVVICIHSHQAGPAGKEVPEPFLIDFAHQVIDGGADAVIGSGPHLLRPIEIYHDRPIFYSLGDFIMQLENVQKAPADFFAKAGLPGNASLKELFEARSAGGKKGLFYDPVMFEAVVPYWETEDGRLTKLVLLPVEEHFGEGHSSAGWPSPNREKGILERLAKMSEPYGTRIEIKDGVGIVRW